MTDARPKHKPNEKHTLDEVLKSLKDLVHGEVLDQPAAPASTAAAAPAPPMADMRDIISSLEDLLESDLNLEEKVERAKAALAPVAQPRDRDAKPKAAAAPAKPAPAPEETPQTRLALTPAEPKPAPPPPARPAVPPPPVTPMFDAEDDLEFDIDATPAETPAPVEFPEEMSDDDIAKALAELQTEMDAAPAAQPEPDPEIEFIDAEPESIAIEAAPPPPEPAPPLELAIEKPAELAQRDLSPEPAFAPPDTSGLSVVEDEIAAAPDATPAGELTVSELATDTAAEEIIAPAAPTPEDSDFNIDFAPRKPLPQAEPDHVEDLAPPPWEDDGTIDRAEPPTTSGDVASGSLGESIELDLSIADTVGGDAPRPDAVAELAPETEVIVTEIIAPPAPTEPEIATTPAPTAMELKVVEPDAEIVATEVIAPPEPEPVAPPAPAKKELTIIEPDAPPAKKPKPPAAKPAREIPVLKDVAIAPSPATAPESFTLELTPATPPKPAPPQDLHQMAVRIIAKLNIEMRKAGKPPLDVKTINRLQQLLKEALEKK